MPVSTNSREVWIGLASVHQRPGTGVLMDGNDAFVQALALVSSVEEYRAAMQRAFDDLGFDLFELEDVEPLGERMRHSKVDASLVAKAREVEATGFPRFGPFVTWISDN